MRIEGGQVLLPSGLAGVSLTLADGRIEGIDAAASGPVLDAGGLLVLPGIVDIHGDAFERQMQPRPGVAFPPGLALADTEAQLLASGITTAYHGVTLSWEPGLRGLAAWRAMLDALAARRWSCDMRAHLRWELHNLDALDEALADIAAGRVHLLAFNDHTPSICRKLGQETSAVKFAERAMLGLEEFRALARRALERLPEVPEATARLAAAARARGLPMASHDDDTVEGRDAYRAMGARICEFPVTESVAQAARAAGDWVVMGAPNVVRGGSHIGWASAAEMVRRGLCTVLCSDYFYPALPQAALRLATEGLGWARAWELVSTAPADAACLGDRGRIAPGLRADLVLLDPAQGRVVATLAGGRVAHLTEAGWERLEPGRRAVVLPA